MAARDALDVALIVLGGTLVGSVAFNAFAYLGAARHRRRHPPACPADDDELPRAARALAGLRAFTIECGVTALLMLTVPLSFRRLRVRAVADGDPRRPVALLHGYALHATQFLWLRRRLRRDGGLRLYSVRQAALGGDIDRSAARLGDALDRIRRESGSDAVDVVAYGVDGLVARALLAARGPSSGIARLITLGTPHQGTLAFPGVAAAAMVAQVRPGSALLSGLAANDRALDAAECVSIYTADDAIVVPPSAAYWPGAFNIEVRGLGHTSLLFSRRVYELVRENLAAPIAAADAPRGASVPA